MKLTDAEKVQAHRLRERIYARHAAGCCWHITLDDGNVGDSSVEFCIKYAEENPCGHPECRELGPLMRRMSLTQRLKMYRGGYPKLAQATP